MILPKFIFGLHPGGHGNRHLSITDAPIDANIVYIGGDSQKTDQEFGAKEYSGRLFRGNASKFSGMPYLTNSSAKKYPLGGDTASNSAPHSDSRDMDFAVDGVLIEGDDGGVNRRTQPQNNSVTFHFV
jgi:hypothetical protein